MAIGLLAGLVPSLLPGFGLTTKVALRAVARFGTVGLAARFAIRLLRTMGFIMNTTGFLPGLPFPSTPFTRLVTGPSTFINPFGFPGTNSFLKGIAYKDTTELADGWLSFFGELALQDVPGVDTSIENAIDALNRGDFGTFGAEAADALSGEIGLADLAAFFNGVAQVERDWQALGLPTLHPAPWVFGGLTGAVVWLDDIFGKTGRRLGEIIEGADEKMEELGFPLDPGLRRGLEEGIEDVIAEGPEELRQVVGAFTRFREGLSDLARIIDLLKRTGA